MERDSLLKAARRDSTEALGKQRNAACVNTHPTFGNLSDKPPLAKIATHHATPYLVSVIKAIDATQGGPPPEPSGAELVDDGELAESAAVADPLKSVEELSHNEGPVKSEILNPKSEVPLLTLEEKRRILARIARVNATDCFDESGNFDIARAKRVLPPGAVCSISIHETTCPTAEGQSMTERRIHLRLVDPVSALRLDDQLERRRERSASRSSSATDSDSPPPHPASPEYAHMLLRKNTIALDEANHTLAQLRKALAEKEDRRRRLSKELDEKDHQLSETPSLSNGSQTLSPSNGSQTLSKVEGEAAQHDTGCQPVQEELQTSPGCQPVASKSQNPSSQTLSNIEGDAEDSSLAPQRRDQSREAGFSTPLSPKSKPLSPVEAPAPTIAERLQVLTKLKNPTPTDLKELEALGFLQEAEEVKNSSGPGAFADWLRARGIDPATYRSPLPGHLPSVKYQMARPSARPPPKYDSMSFAAQGRPKEDH